MSQTSSSSASRESSSNSSGGGETAVASKKQRVGQIKNDSPTNSGSSGRKDEVKFSDGDRMRPAKSTKSTNGNDDDAENAKTIMARSKT